MLKINCKRGYIICVTYLLTANGQIFTVLINIVLNNGLLRSINMVFVFGVWYFLQEKIDWHLFWATKRVFHGFYCLTYLFEKFLSECVLL